MQKTVDYYVHESIIARMERNNRRMMILAILLLIAVILSNVCWIVLT